VVSGVKAGGWFRGRHHGFPMCMEQDIQLKRGKRTFRLVVTDSVKPKTVVRARRVMPGSFRRCVALQYSLDFR